LSNILGPSLDPDTTFANRDFFPAQRVSWFLLPLLTQA
jgi:hypothetical protein